ncbi:MAG TPA: dTMP kinase [Thermoanaerobaculia bacterium]|nr:dTMP kinase [Thermoanaerobaculia bacterium]
MSEERVRGEGFFLAIEGIEGSGKTTQVGRLEQALRATGRNVVVTKEPGGTQLGNRIRAILLDPQEEGMDPLAELFLYAASRRQHVAELIRPSLERGAVVLCDRFTDATLAYQGFGRMLELDRLRQLNDWSTEGIRPDLTVILDLPEALGLERARARNAAEDLHGESRFEGEDVRFHRRVREGYLTLAEAEPQRYLVIDASGDPDAVFERLTSGLRERAPVLRLDPAASRS